MNYSHKKIAEEICRLDQTPGSDDKYAEWIKAGAHLDFLKQNMGDGEFVVYASGPMSFIHTIAVEAAKLDPLDKDDLLQWSLNPYTSAASYVTGGGRDDVWIERGLRHAGSKTLEGGTQLIFGRTFEGMSDASRDYYEVSQEYSHLTGIHWRKEHKAYCRYDGNGDMENLVTVTTRSEKGSDLSLVTFKWDALEQYLSASNMTLVRMFDFTLLRYQGFSGWSRDMDEFCNDQKDISYRQKIMPGYAAYTRGFQIIRPRLSGKEAKEEITRRWFGERGGPYVEFLAHDWRNQRIAKISTDPAGTTNYFEAGNNELPFELSPAFFKPEVLLKYKADRDKYTVGEREVSCRAAWHLRGIDTNEAGQLHAYICDLRKLPYSEQLHWLSCNEAPKAGISERAVTNDFEGKWVTFEEPLRKVIRIVDEWRRSRPAWWTLRNERLPENVNTPLSSSRDEWAEAFMDLAKLVIEGFEAQPIRAVLQSKGIAYEKLDGTLTLLEKLLTALASDTDRYRLGGLRTVQELRSKAKGHAGGSDAQEHANRALAEHGSYAEHFRHVCSSVAEELELIEHVLGAA